MIKKIIISTCLLISFVSFAQQGTASPYSFYGIGDVKFKGTLEFRSMAGVAVEQDSIHLNIENPASYASLGQTTFSVGGTFGTSKIKTEGETSKAQRTTFDYLAVGIPMGKFGAAFGLVPLSAVGYRIANDNTDTPGAVSSQLEGKGGVNKVFFGLGYKITPKWNIGADVQYNFGKITTTSIELVTDVQNATREENISKISGATFNIGTMYQTKIYKKTNLYTSLSYNFSGNLNSDNTRTAQVDGDADSYTYPVAATELKLPGKFTIGAGIGEARKWLIGTTLAFQGEGKLNNHYNTVSNVRYENYAKYAIGGYYIPNYTSFSSYFSRITYRAGLKYEKIGLVIKNESVNDVGMSLGAGLPITGSFSNVNFGIEFGKRGTTNSGLVQENYLNFSVGFSFNDKWFVKSKYN
ncbi:outer membrane protein transport protein [Flavobacterium sp. ENC]|uniref:outer membrane protein transport protein n=1 Tax=Flavobacterium sp. ENC TaxID=2897330 RepID=UPI001E48635B|nr:outer membrane protein transport protein [Flavobacterium sp. ENC]MCD0464012.1 outer membrane protein transport protein [Flavobacterium sp. ENC]